MDFDAGLYKPVSNIMKPVFCTDSIPVGTACPLFPKFAPCFIWRPPRFAVPSANWKELSEGRRQKDGKGSLPGSQGQFPEKRRQILCSPRGGIRDLACPQASSGASLEGGAGLLGGRRTGRSFGTVWRTPSQSGGPAGGIPSAGHPPSQKPAGAESLLGGLRYLQFPTWKGRKGGAPFVWSLAAPWKTCSLLNGRFRNLLQEGFRRCLPFREVKAECPPDQEEPVPFRWTVSRLRPQLRYSLASRVISGILSGQYHCGQAIRPPSQDDGTIRGFPQYGAAFPGYSGTAGRCTAPAGKGNAGLYGAPGNRLFQAGNPGWACGSIWKAYSC